jgi:dihydrofolate reductase
MRKVIVSNNVTLDGRVDEMRDWALPFDPDEFIKYHTDLVSHSDGLLLGRKTYEFLAAVWPSRSGELPDRFNSMAWSEWTSSSSTPP